MREIGAFEAKNKLSALLADVEAGAEITITRRGKPVAKLVRPDAGADRGTALAAVARMRALRDGVTLGGAASLRDLIEDGRRDGGSSDSAFSDGGADRR